jgi:hypothetical protein
MTIMSNKLLAGVWRTMVGVPPFLWENQIERNVFSSGRKNEFESGVRHTETQCDRL